MAERITYSYKCLRYYSWLFILEGATYHMSKFTLGTRTATWKIQTCKMVLKPNNIERKNNKVTAIDPSLLCCLLRVSCNNIGSNNETNCNPKQYRLTDGNLGTYSFWYIFFKWQKMMTIITTAATTLQIRIHIKNVFYLNGNW